MRKKSAGRFCLFAAVLSVLFLVSCKYDTNLLDRQSAGNDSVYTDSGYVSADSGATSYVYVYSSATSSGGPVTDGVSSAVNGQSAVSQSAVSQSAVTQTPNASAPVTSPTVTAAPQTAAPTTQAANYAAYTPAQVVDLLSRAVNKTKGYTGAITVHHTESFDNPSITNVEPGGSLMQSAIDFVVNLVVKPTAEDYHFSGGYATTSEGEQTQLLLPKAAPFTLSAAGVQSATAAEENGMVHVKITLKPEQCTSLTQIPTYNASSIGYLDIASKFSVLQIQEVNIQYPGSTIDAYIRPDGYVQSATYVISLNAYAKAKAMGITGSANFSGNQTEVWNIQW